MADKQRLRNMLSQIEDEARQARNSQSDIDQRDLDMRNAFHLIASLAKLVREEIVQ